MPWYIGNGMIVLWRGSNPRNPRGGGGGGGELGAYSRPGCCLDRISKPAPAGEVDPLR